LFAGFQGFISPESFNLFESIIVLCMIVLGGMGNIAGVILGAVLLTIFPEALRYLGELQNYLFGRILADPADLRMLIFGLALVLIMIFRPAGLLPSVRRRQEFGSDASVLAQEQASLYDARR
jgi:branched-chain amino acid transport system permease protein